MLAGGAVFTMLGISLFFNKSLMRLGNLLFIAGIPMTIGPGRTMGYFLQPKKARATGCLILGIFLVMVGWPIFGIALEAFGLLNLFGNMFPVLMVILKQIPFIGNLMGGNNGGRKEKQRRSRKDEYYGETGIKMKTIIRRDTTNVVILANLQHKYTIIKINAYFILHFC